MEAIDNEIKYEVVIHDMHLNSTYVYQKDLSRDEAEDLENELYENGDSFYFSYFFRKMTE